MPTTFKCKAAILMRLAAILIVAGPATAQDTRDTEPGKLLYEAHCGGCHYERLHDRQRSKIKNLRELRDEVASWAPQTRHVLTLDEREAVVQYLNAAHYRFGLPGKKPGP